MEKWNGVKTTTNKWRMKIDWFVYKVFLYKNLQIMTSGTIKLKSLERSIRSLIGLKHLVYAKSSFKKNYRSANISWQLYETFVSMGYRCIELDWFSFISFVDSWTYDWPDGKWLLPCISNFRGQAKLLSTIQDCS